MAYNFDRDAGSANEGYFGEVERSEGKVGDQFQISATQSRIGFRTSTPVEGSTLDTVIEGTSGPTTMIIRASDYGMPMGPGMASLPGRPGRIITPSSPPRPHWISLARREAMVAMVRALPSCATPLEDSR